MENKKLLIGAGVVIIVYLLWKKSQNDELNKRVQNMTKLADDLPKYTSEMGMSKVITEGSTISEKRKLAQSNLDMINQIFTDLNRNSKQEKRNGILYQVDNNGKDIGFWSGDKFTRTDGKDKLIEQYRKNIKDLGFTFLDTKVLTQSEYEIEKNKMF
jgi:hypothetical protein